MPLRCRRWQASVPSSAASRRSNIVTVGLDEARVGEGLFLVGEAARRGLGVGLHEAAGQVQRFGVLAPGLGRRPSRTACVAQPACRRAGPRAAMLVLSSGSSALTRQGLGSARRERVVFRLLRCAGAARSCARKASADDVAGARRCRRSTRPRSRRAWGVEATPSSRASCASTSW